MPLPNGLQAIAIGQQDARAALNANFAALDQNRLRSGLYSARPANGGSGYGGQLFLATDRNVIYRDSGTAWVAVLSSRIRSVAASGAIETDEGTLLVDSSGATRTMTLPAAATATRATGLPLAIKRLGANSVDVAPQGGEQIEDYLAGAPVTISNDLGVLWLASDGTKWHVLDLYTP